MTVASDESYRDHTNLLGKLQKHQAFEAELTANSERVNALEMVRTYIRTYIHILYMYVDTHSIHMYAHRDTQYVYICTQYTYICTC